MLGGSTVSKAVSVAPPVMPESEAEPETESETEPALAPAPAPAPALPDTPMAETAKGSEGMQTVMRLRPPTKKTEPSDSSSGMCPSWLAIKH